MTLGYRGNPAWRDMSNYLVHLTEECLAWQSILYRGFVEPSGPFGWLSTHRDAPDSQKSSCLSEIPLDYLDRLTERHGSYGVVFEMEFVIGQGGARVWYLDKDRGPAKALFDLLGNHYPKIDRKDPLLEVTPFIDYLSDARSFEWEREWRVPGGLKFSARDVRYLFLPEVEHVAARYFFDTSAADGQGPDLRHAGMIDSRWSNEQIQEVL